MEEAGIRTRLFETARHPVVYGEAGEPGAEKAILIYGHYDVQPPEPLAEWLSPPFEPALRDGKIYGRGSSDNKGQLFAHVKGLQSYVEAKGGLPRGLKMKYIFEGEEEISSQQRGRSTTSGPRSCRAPHGGRSSRPTRES